MNIPHKILIVFYTALLFILPGHAFAQANISGQIDVLTTEILSGKFSRLEKGRLLLEVEKLADNQPYQIQQKYHRLKCLFFDPNTEAEFKSVHQYLKNHISLAKQHNNIAGLYDFEQCSAAIHLFAGNYIEAMTLLDKLTLQLTNELPAKDVGSTYELRGMVNLRQGQVALNIAERVRKAVAALEFSELDSNITISSGLTQRRNELDISVLIKGADEKLYQAKESGKNKVCC